MATPPVLGRIVVAIDPPVTATVRSDSCGVVAAGQGRDGQLYVLADHSVQGRTPDLWARAAVDLYRHHEADCLVAEVNQGGDMVAAVLQHVEAGLPVKKVRATRGKWLRAEPVAALYADGQVHHVGQFPELEEQMLTYGTNAWVGGRSPDRLDALVWAITELMSSPAILPNIRLL